MGDNIFPENPPPKKSKRIWWLVGLAAALAYFALMFWLLFSVYAANLSFVIPLRNWYQNTILSFLQVDWNQVRSGLTKDCKITGQSMEDYSPQLFKAFGNDVVWDSETGRFISSTNKPLVIFPIPLSNRALALQDQQASCWVAAIYNTPSTGKIIYKNQAGEFITLSVKNLPK